MRPHERRESNAYPYFKLASWDARNLTWRDGRTVQETEGDCRKQARKPGQYRVSRIEESGRTDLAAFNV